MEKYTLIVDEKVETWRRSYVRVEADSFDEAVDRCIKEGSACGDIFESDIIYECEELMKPRYEGEITIEVMDEHHNIIKDA